MTQTNLRGGYAAGKNKGGLHQPPPSVTVTPWSHGTVDTGIYGRRWRDVFNAAHHRATVTGQRMRVQHTEIARRDGALMAGWVARPIQRPSDAGSRRVTT